MPITEADVEKVAQLAHMEITSEELKIFAPQMAEIVSYVEQLNEVPPTIFRRRSVASHRKVKPPIRLATIFRHPRWARRRRSPKPPMRPLVIFGFRKCCEQWAVGSGQWAVVLKTFKS